MNYELIDKAITCWAAKYTLHLCKKYRDEEVRSVDLVGSNGSKCQLWIDVPNQVGDVEVHVWDYNRRQDNYKTSAADLPECLDKAYMTAIRWLN